MVLDPVGTRHISQMLEMQKTQMMGGGETMIQTTVELDGEVLGTSMERRIIRQLERGIDFRSKARQSYMAL